MKALLSPRHALQATQPVGEDPSASSVGIAAPSESKVPSIYAKARPFLCAVLAGVR